MNIFVKESQVMSKNLPQNGQIFFHYTLLAEKNSAPIKLTVQHIDDITSVTNVKEHRGILKQLFR